MLRAEVQLAWKTQAGHRHQMEGRENEDAVFVTYDHPLFDAVVMVADGMGGHPRPREASEAAVRAARALLFDSNALQPALSGSGGGIAQALAAATHAAHRAVRGLRTGAGKAPGTTLSVAVLADGALHLAHVGDGSVYLMRDGQARSLAGGEDKRLGNRPAQYLGQDEPLEPELCQLPVAAADRFLLCTDGLTRYFREAGPEALERVLGRDGVEVQVIASQLTAHSRPDSYDDDTTVALLEVTGLTRAPRSVRSPRAGRDDAEEVMPGSTRTGARGWGVGTVSACAAAAAVVGVVAGFLTGRLTAPLAEREGPGVAGGSREPADAASLAHLPAGNIVLLDERGNRLFSLVTAAGSLGGAAVDLRALKVGKDGRISDAGRFRLDPARAELTDSDGRTYPVEVEGASLRILLGGTLVVTTRPAGAEVRVDGRVYGPSPQRMRVPAGRHQVQVRGRNWTNRSAVEVLPGRSTTLNLEAR